MRKDPVLAGLTKKKTAHVIAYVDGASRGNPGPASAGVVIQHASGATLKTLSTRIGTATNNIAEYCALILAMQEALILGVKELEVRTDSELLAKQFNGEYKIKEDSLKNLSTLIRHLKRGFEKVTVVHVPREQNKLADREANRALDQDLFL